MTGPVFDNIVEFKSIPVWYEKEKVGIKNNTVRFIDDQDNRFMKLRNGCKRIRIRNTETEKCFERNISDYSEWQGFAIITWRHTK